MSERMLSVVQTVEKGGRPVFPLMPFSAFSWVSMALLRKTPEKKETKSTDRKTGGAMKKTGVLDFISAEQRMETVRFSLDLTAKGKLYCTGLTRPG